MFNHASGQLLPEHTWNPAAHRTFRGLMFSKTSGQLLREHTRNPRHLDLHPHTRHRKMFVQQDCCARTPQAHLDLSLCKEACSDEKTAAFSRREHTWISLRAQARRHVHATDCCLRTPQALGSLSVRKRACSGKTSAAFSRREHTWISLRAQRGMFHRKDCCDLALPQDR